MGSSRASSPVDGTGYLSYDGAWKTGRFPCSRHGWLYGGPECDRESVRIHGVDDVLHSAMDPRRPGKHISLGVMLEWVLYFFKSEPCDRTHCQLPLGIFTHVSAQRALTSMGLPLESVPFDLNTMMATAVCPFTVI